MKKVALAVVGAVQVVVAALMGLAIGVLPETNLLIGLQMAVIAGLACCVGWLAAKD